MPARINKRQQREQEELLALGNQPVTAVDVDSEEEPTSIAPSGFAAVSSTLEQHLCGDCNDGPSFPLQKMIIVGLRAMTKHLSLQRQRRRVTVIYYDPRPTD
jgi:hypothetical protein